MDKAKVYFDKIKDFIKQMDKKKRLLYTAIIGICIALSVLIVCILNYKNYVVLYKDLDVEECSSIVKSLDDMSIKYKLEGDDTIYVPSADESKVKMELASQGYPKSALNYDIFTKNVDFMTTDYEKTEYSRMQLQERLQASIKTLDNVEDAIVTITIPNNSLAVLNEDKVAPSASAIITLKNGVTLSEDQIKGVELLISRSVPNLSIDNVSILDQTGKALNEKTNDATLISTANKVQTETDISNLISGRIETVLAPVYGKSNLSIGVNVILDYSSKVSESTQYTPTTDNTGVINKYDQTYEGSGNGSGTAASGVPGTKTNSEVTQYATENTSSTDGSISNDVSVDYSVNELKEQVQKQGAEIKDLTVSVLIDKKTMSNEEQTQIKGIIANAAGVNINKVQLYNTEFTAANAQEEASNTNKKAVSSSIVDLSLKQISIIILIILILAVIFVPMLIIKSKHKKRKLLEKLDNEPDGIDAFIPDAIKIQEVAKITESKEQQLTKEIREFSAKAPQITASLLRTLLKGDLE